MGFLDKLFGIDDAKNAAINAANKNRKVANSAYSNANDLLRPIYNQGMQGYDMLANFLGVNGPGKQQAAFDNYVQGPDVQFRMNQGINAIDNSSAARTGGVMTGGLLKRLNEYGQGVATQDFGNYLQRLGAFAGSGQNAANALNASNYQTAGLISAANTSEGNAIANASLAGGNILGNIIGGGMNLFGNLYGSGGFNPFSRQGYQANDPWKGIR